MSKHYKTIDVSTPQEGRVVSLNRYWLCKDGEPEKAIFFGRTAQCNKNLNVVERMRKFTESKTGWNVKVVYIDIAYRPTPEHYVAVG